MMSSVLLHRSFISWITFLLLFTCYISSITSSSEDIQGTGDYDTNNLSHKNIRHLSKEDREFIRSQSNAVSRNPLEHCKHLIEEHKRNKENMLKKKDSDAKQAEMMAKIKYINIPDEVAMVDTSEKLKELASATYQKANSNKGDGESESDIAAAKEHSRSMMTEICDTILANIDVIHRTRGDQNRIRVGTLY